MGGLGGGLGLGGGMSSSIPSAQTILLLTLSRSRRIGLRIGWPWWWSSGWRWYDSPNSECLHDLLTNILKAQVHRAQLRALDRLALVAKLRVMLALVVKLVLMATLPAVDTKPLRP
jgi:hypothetical protein